MTDSELPEGTRKLIAAEVKKQLEPISKSVDEVKEQNRVQSNLLTVQVREINDIGIRLRGLWGNGKGPPGYLENARKEDKEWKEEMFETIGELKANAFREEGKEELRKEMEINRREIEQLADAQKTHRWTRAQVIFTLLGSFAGTWFLSLIRPAFHAAINEIVKQMK